MGHSFESAVRALVTMTGTVTLTATDIDQQTIYNYDPGGAARDLVLPDASAANKGTILFVHNAADAAEVLTIKSTAQATIVTPTQNEAAFVVSTGAVWFGIAGADS